MLIQLVQPPFQLIKKIFQLFTIWLQSLEAKTLNAVNTQLLEQKSFKKIIKALKNRTACLIANHGQVAFGENLEKTFELAQEIENICHQYINAIRIEYLRYFQKRNENCLR